MPIITVHTKINAPINRVFDLARSIDLHKDAAIADGEKAIAGKTSGLIEMGESVTWEATHFFIKQQLSSKITAFEKPYLFIDVMQNGAFKSFTHQHIFKEENGESEMTDIFDYKSPYGLLGKLVDFLFLKRYMHKVLKRKNALLKEVAEGDEWKKYIQTNMKS